MINTNLKVRYYMQSCESREMALALQSNTSMCNKVLQPQLGKWLPCHERAEEPSAHKFGPRARVQVYGEYVSPN